MINQTTLLVTACGRPDLLYRTLDSLNGCNPLRDFAAVVVHEDMPGTKNGLTKAAFPFIKWLEPGKRRGHMGALDELYRHATTPYIFHCEDDWEFYGGQFLHESFLRLDNDPHCLQVWLRAHHDTNEHPVVWIDGLPRMDVNGHLHTSGRGLRANPWRGFSLNPGLRRYREFGMFPFSLISAGFKGWAAEKTIGEHFFRHGFYAGITANPLGYCRHIGEGRHMEDTGGVK